MIIKTDNDHDNSTQALEQLESLDKKESRTLEKNDGTRFNSNPAIADAAATTNQTRTRKRIKSAD